MEINALDTFGNYQRPVFSLSVSIQYAYTTEQGQPVKSWAQLVRKSTLVAQLCVLFRCTIMKS